MQGPWWSTAGEAPLAATVWALFFVQCHTQGTGHPTATVSGVWLAGQVPKAMTLGSRCPWESHWVSSFRLIFLFWFLDYIHQY